LNRLSHAALAFEIAGNILALIGQPRDCVGGEYVRYRESDGAAIALSIGVSFFDFLCNSQAADQ
jgi:hypothetical protein